MDPHSVADELRAYFESHPEGIVCAWLFGSVARGTARPDSDVDVAVLYERDPPETLDASAAAIGGDIEAATGLPVDLVILNRAPVDLIHRVLRDGVLLVEQDRDARVRFEVKARNEFFDLKPHLDRYRRVAERDHARRAAEEALLDRALIAVTPQAHEEFLKRLDRPADPSERLRRTMRTRAPWQTR